VKAYIEEASQRMPVGIELTAYQDYSQYLESRLELLLRNGRNGFILVFLVLALFLRFRLAFWVSIGIPISFLGTLWLMPGLGVSLNMLSLFAFLLVLGIVVDNAIVVGENIYSHHQRGKDGLQAAIEGTHEVLVPVVFAIGTTIAAFLPMLLVEGNTGKVLKSIPLIVIPTLVFSLIICLYAVPHHLTRLPRARDERGFHPLRRVQATFRNGLERFVVDVYQPVLEWCLRWRYLTLAMGLGSLLICAGLLLGGWLRFQFFPPVEGDDIAAFVTMPEGVSPEVVRDAVQQVEAAALELRRELEGRGGEEGNGVFRHMLASMGDQPYRTAVSRNAGGERDVRLRVRMWARCTLSWRLRSSGP
jgi:multidrug efflux pump subunit AcrB